MTDAIVTMSPERSKAISDRGRQARVSKSNASRHCTQNHNPYEMTTNTEFTIDALSTESRIDTVFAAPEAFDMALEAFVCAAQILDQFKRNIYYGEKGQFDLEKLSHYIVNLEGAASALRMIGFNEVLEGQKVVFNADPRITHGIIGVATEAGELVEALLEAKQGEADFINMKEEIGDVHWYLSVLADACGLTTDQCLEAVIKKLKDKKKGRYADGFSSENAVDRNKEAERELLSE